MIVNKSLFKNGFKKIILGTSVFAFSVILSTGNSNAVLQANGNESAKYNINQWMANVRKMESIGGAMGLSETLNSDLTASSDSNNIDVHMQKNTEYGALAILSASSYGNPSKIADGETTTGNITGVVMRLNTEWVALGTISSASTYYNAASRYKNVQNATYVAQKGDAISETSGWHGSASNSWMLHGDYDSTNKVPFVCGLVRAYSGSIFSYNGHCGSSLNTPAFTSYGVAYYTKAWSSRAVVVIGEGV